MSNTTKRSTIQEFVKHLAHTCSARKYTKFALDDAINITRRRLESTVTDIDALAALYASMERGYFVWALAMAGGVAPMCKLLQNGRASAAGSTWRPSNDQQRVATSLPSTREASTAAQAPSTAPVSTPKPQEQSRKRGLDTAPPSQTAPLNAEGDDFIARDAEGLAHAEERSKKRRRTTRQERVAAGKFVDRENPPVTAPATAHGPAPVQTTSANSPPLTGSAAAPVLSTTQTFGSPPLSPIPTAPNPTPARIQTTNAASAPSPAPKAALTPTNNTSPPSPTAPAAAPTPLEHSPKRATDAVSASQPCHRAQETRRADK